MIFTERRSALVRLSDCIKIGLDLCAEASEKILEIFVPYEPLFRKAQEAAGQFLEKHSYLESAEQEIRGILFSIPDDVVFQGAYFQVRLHSQALSTILSCCFCLESYINSLAYYLLKESDFLGLIKDGNITTVEILTEAINRMSTRDKWKTVGLLRNAKGFDCSCSPFQDFQILYNFRDDHVHDKVVPWTQDRASKRYNNKFPDPVFGLLELNHALYAGKTYWDMIQEVHRLIGVKPELFQRHYNLAPWRDDKHLHRLKETASRYSERLKPPSGPLFS